MDSLKYKVKAYDFVERKTFKDPLNKEFSSLTEARGHAKKIADQWCEKGEKIELFEKYETDNFSIEGYCCNADDNGAVIISRKK